MTKLSRPIPKFARAKSSGALLGLHQVCACGGRCGGMFRCQGCKRQVGNCVGGGDDFPVHCNDCWAIRLRVIEFVAKNNSPREDVIGVALQDACEHELYYAVLADLVWRGFLYWFRAEGSPSRPLLYRLTEAGRAVIR